MKNHLVYALSLFLALSRTASGQDLKVADIFSDNMVLQQNSDPAIWGSASKGEKISVTASWDSKTYNTIADKNGHWKITIHTPVASYSLYQVKVQASKTILLNNVLIGEVWLASGQSNMSMPLKGYYCQPVSGSTSAVLRSAHRKINFINIPPVAAYTPIDTFSAVWQEARPDNAGECSAVAWFFAEKLQEDLDVPIGIINSSYGGSTVEAWMDQNACRSFKDIKVPVLKNETSKDVNNVPTVLFNGMIHPLIGYGLKGVIWYQGESNIFNVSRYAPSVVRMVEEWRKLWGAGDFPFYYAQITPYDYKEWNFFTPEHSEISAYLRETQSKVQMLLNNSAMSVNLDLGLKSQIHPSAKKEVGERLALLALNKSYGQKGFEAESPQFEKMTVEEEKAIIHFNRQFNGITSNEKTLQLFEIAGENKVFHKAEAYIDQSNGTIVVSNKLVKEPKAVRYAFKDWVEGEVFGTGGLPVPSFRTDDW